MLGELAETEGQQRKLPCRRGGSRPICRIAWLIAEHARRKTIIIGGRPSMEGWTAAYHAAGIRPRDGASDGAAPRMGPMTAIVYFGEMLVAYLLAIVLLAISQLRMS